MTDLDLVFRARRVITAAGSHRELLAREPAYANLMSMEEVTR